MINKEHKILLRYFTGTGNSLRILSVCKDLFEANCFTPIIESIFDKQDMNAEYDYYGFCFPVYALGLPRVVKQNLRQLPVAKNVKTLLLVSLGAADEEGWSLKDGINLLKKKGYDVIYSDCIVMPDNWAPFAKTPSPDEAKAIINNGEKHAKDAVEAFINGTIYHKKMNYKKYGVIVSYLYHYLFSWIGVRNLWRLFTTDENCTGCGLCEKICPMKAIRIIDKKPTWSRLCEQCMRCYNFCPNEAIHQLESIGKGSSHYKYKEPHFKI
jgi:ferredoxin